MKTINLIFPLDASVPVATMNFYWECQFFQFCGNTPLSFWEKVRNYFLYTEQIYKTVEFLTRFLRRHFRVGIKLSPPHENAIQLHFWASFPSLKQQFDMENSKLPSMIPPQGIEFHFSGFSSYKIFFFTEIVGVFSTTFLFFFFLIIPSNKIS